MFVIAGSAFATTSCQFAGYYRLVNVGSGKLLEITRDLSGKHSLHQRSYLGSKGQNWEIVRVGDDDYRITNRDYPLALDLVEGSHEDGARVFLWEYQGGNNQKWKLAESEDNTWVILNCESGKALEIPDGQHQEQISPTQWGLHGGAFQRWRIERVDDGFSGTHFIENEFVRVGIDLNAGGAIHWVSLQGSERNLVNVHDRGRYIQQSYYAGNSLDRRDEGQSRFWSPFPWNPIQAGDYYGNEPAIMEFKADPTEIYVKSRPLLWDMNGEYAQAYIETWLRLEGPDIVYRGRLTRFVSESRWGNRVVFQELPACYLNKELKHFYSYTGHEPWSFRFHGIPSSRIWEKWETHESWVACVDDKMMGFAVYFPGVSSFAGGFYNQGEGSDPTAYVAPILHVHLNDHDTYEFECFFLTGHLAEIHNRIYVRKHLSEMRALGVIP